VAGLKQLRRAKRSAYVFINERGDPFKRMGIARMIERAGQSAELDFPVHVHSLRHAAATALPRPRLDPEHSEIHRNERGAV
jgi:site-specific recombinase XerD